MKPRHWFILLVAVLLIIGATAYRYWMRVDRGDFAPEVQFQTLDGREVSISDYRGRFVLLHFWATWCDVCQSEMPSLNTLMQKLPSERFVILGVSIDQGKDVVEKLRRYMLAVPMEFPVLIDEKGKGADRYGVYGVPETLLIDPQGVIVGRVTGAQDWSAPQSMSMFQQMLQSQPE